MVKNIEIYVMYCSQVSFHVDTAVLLLAYKMFIRNSHSVYVLLKQARHNHSVNVTFKITHDGYIGLLIYKIFISYFTEKNYCLYVIAYTEVQHKL